MRADAGKHNGISLLIGSPKADSHSIYEWEFFVSCSINAGMEVIGMQNASMINASQS